MAMYSPPMTPELNPDVREHLLHWLDQEIQATQIRHDEARRRIQHERQHATTHEPLKEQDQGQFDNADANANENTESKLFSSSSMITPLT